MCQCKPGFSGDGRTSCTKDQQRNVLKLIKDNFSACINFDLGAIHIVFLIQPSIILSKLVIDKMVNICQI